MKRLIVITLATVALAALMGPVHAQRSKGAPNAEEQQKREETARIERQYKATLKRMENKTENVVVDPWKDMRGTDAPKTKR